MLEDKKPDFNRAFCRLPETHYLFKECHWVDRRGILADFEVKLWLLGVGAHSRGFRCLAALDLLAAGDAEGISRSVDSDRSVVVAQQHRISEFLQAVAGVDDD